DARSPILAGAFPTYQRLVTALDTGGAIRGPIRADLYLGQGPEAGLEAGRIRHVLRLYRLVPRP
ncbi:3D domain-containing protein, partial [Phenylobacterium sp.]